MIQSIIKLWHRPKQTDWKKPVEVFYSDKGNIMTVTTLDQNSKDYYHTINDPEWSNGIEWRNHPSRTPVKDKELIKQLNSYYPLVLRGKKIRGGWVKSL